ncbi:MAG: DUF3348 family protein [Halioglobus sp.]
MSQPSPQVSQSSSRLVRFLSDLTLPDVQVTHRQFSERLAQLIDLPDSIALASAHGNLTTLPFEPASASGEEIREEFLQARTSMLQKVISSFAPGSGTSRIRLPASTAGIPLADEARAEPYLKFYMAHQRQMDFAVQNLRGRVREALTGLSPQLAQLAALDTALGDTLSIHARKFFATVPRLLEQRFSALVDEFQHKPPLSQDQPNDWPQLMQRFGVEMQGLLLAEVEARLLPVLGMVEAINETPENTPYE